MPRRLRRIDDNGSARSRHSNFPGSTLARRQLMKPVGFYWPTTTH